MISKNISEKDIEIAFAPIIAILTSDNTRAGVFALSAIHYAKARMLETLTQPNYMERSGKL